MGVGQVEMRELPRISGSTSSGVAYDFGCEGVLRHAVYLKWQRIVMWILFYIPSSLNSWSEAGRYSLPSPYLASHAFQHYGNMEGAY